MKKTFLLLTIISMLLTISFPTIIYAESNSPATEKLHNAEPISALPETSNFLNVFSSETNYISIQALQETQSYQTNDMNFAFDISSYQQYDYATISYLSTPNTILYKYESKTITYSDLNTPIKIAFSLLPNSLNEGTLLDYHILNFEEIVITIDVFIENSIVETKTRNIYILSTSDGFFVTSADKLYAYENYLTHMYYSEKINSNEYYAALQRMHELPVSLNLNEVSQEYANEILSQTPSNDIVYKYYDANSQTICSDTKHIINQKKSASLQQTLSTTQSTVQNQTRDYPILNVIPTKISLTRSIYAENSGQKITIYGELKFSDSSGIFHPCANAQITVYDENGTVDTALKTIYTDNNGNYTATINNNISSSENGYDLYLEIKTKNNDFKIKDSLTSTIFSDSFFILSTVMNDVKTSSNTLQTGWVGDIITYKAFSIHQALNVGYSYFHAMNGNNTPFATVLYNNSIDQSFASSSDNQIQINSQYYHVWDTIIHELGHLAAAVNNCHGSQAVGDHAFGLNLMCKYQKSKAIQLAWSEGYANYFSEVAQQYYNSNKHNISSIPFVADLGHLYLKFLDGTIRYQNHDLLNYNGNGEADEGSTTSLLINCYLNNWISTSQFWNITKNKQTLSAFINGLYNIITPQQKSYVGELLESYGVVDEPIIPDSGLIYNKSSSTTFSWLPANTDNETETNPYSTSVKLIIYDQNYNSVYSSSFVSSKQSTPKITLSQSQWSQITSAITGNHFYWQLATQQTTSPSTGLYFSRLIKGVFSQNITNITQMDTAYTKTMETGQEYWFSLTVPENAMYSIYSISSGNIDLAAELYRAPLKNNYIFSDNNSGNGNNFLISHNENLSTYATYYIRVFSYGEATGTFNIVCTKTIPASTNANYSGYANGTNATWYKITATTSGTYTFHSTGTTDVKGELFSFLTLPGSTNNRLIHDDSSGDGENFKFSYYLSKGTTVYLRVTGKNSSTSGSYRTYISSPT